MHPFMDIHLTVSSSLPLSDPSLRLLSPSLRPLSPTPLSLSPTPLSLSDPSLPSIPLLVHVQLLLLLMERSWLQGVGL